MMNCREFLELADSYLGNELLVETNHDLLKHLEACAGCRRELGARREVRAKLRAGFMNAPEMQIEREFTDRLRAQLAATATGRNHKSPRRAALWAGGFSHFFAERRMWLAVAACCLLAATVTLVSVRRNAEPQLNAVLASRETKTPGTLPATNPRATSAENNSRAPVQIVKAELTDAAAGDHENCAVKFNLSEHPITLDKAGKNYDPAYADLTKAIETIGASPTAEVQFVEAHSCVFEGRRFGHVVLKYRGRLVSLLVTEDDAGKINTPAQTATSGEQLTAQQVNSCAQSDGYQVACFATARHAVFIVSDLPAAENLTLARSLAPAVYAQVRHAEIKV